MSISIIQTVVLGYNNNDHMILRKFPFHNNKEKSFTNYEKGTQTYSTRFKMIWKIIFGELCRDMLPCAQCTVCMGYMEQLLKYENRFLLFV